MAKPIVALVTLLLAVVGLLYVALDRTAIAPDRTGVAMPAGPTLAPGPIDESKLVDLTYGFDANTIYWPTAKPFAWEKESWGPVPTLTRRFTSRKAGSRPTRFRSHVWWRPRS